MDKSLPQQFKEVLNLLSPMTLAYIAADLAMLQAEWANQPGLSPDPAVQSNAATLLALVQRLGIEQTEGGEIEFEQLVEWAKDELQDNDWLQDRLTQERQNWLEDYQ